jgi:hypothetical protein
MGRAEWLRVLLSTEAADRVAAEGAITALYRVAGMEGPRHFWWFESPGAAATALQGLILSHHPVMQQAGVKVKVDPKAEEAGKPLCPEWSYPPPGLDRRMATAVGQGRYKAYADFRGFPLFRDDDGLERAERRLIGGDGSVLNTVLGHSVLGWSFQHLYTMSNMAADEAAIGGREPSAALAAAWSAARSVGLWWGFDHAVVLIERPAELYVNEKLLAHRKDGPALVYRDGAAVYARDGQWSPPFKPPKKKSGVKIEPGKWFGRYVGGEYQKVWEEMIELDADVRKKAYAEHAQAVAAETMRRVEANVRTVTARLQGMGYRFQTAAGAAEEREDSAARSVEAMRRKLERYPEKGPVSRHVRESLEMGARLMEGLAKQVAESKERPRDYRIRAHVPPAKSAAAHVRRLEKLAEGLIPLSLRAFYEVVGSVDWRGSHPGIAPLGHHIAPDPLVVFDAEEIAEHWQEDGLILIAPDDLTKADTSGGDPYEIAVPDARADGELRNEAHELFFVEYLRLCFRWGGFPGWEAEGDGAPKELEELRVGLVEF